MICNKKCPRGTDCKPISNIISDTSFVCMGYHGSKKEKFPQDKFRHCFKSGDTDSMYDYDEYDIKSVMSVMSEALIVDELKSNG